MLLRACLVVVMSLWMLYTNRLQSIWDDVVLELGGETHAVIDNDKCRGFVQTVSYVRQISTSTVAAPDPSSKLFHATCSFLEASILLRTKASSL